MARALRYPFTISDLGTPHTSPRLRSIREQIEQILFTVPGERVNRPRFGCGIQRLVFSGASAEIAASAEYVIQVNLREFLGDLIVLDAVRVNADPESATLFVD